MYKRKYTPSMRRYRKWIKEGRGQGIAEKYQRNDHKPIKGKDLCELEFPSHGMATVTGEGIIFGNLIYFNDKPIQKGRFEKAFQDGSYSVPIVYEKYYLDCIYAKLGDDVYFTRFEALSS